MSGVQHKQKLRASFGQIYQDLKRGPLTFAVWLLAIGAAGVLLQHRSRSLECIGLARALQYEISAPTDGRLATVSVDLLQEVEAGQVVARLDDGLLAGRVRTAAATINQLQANLIYPP